MRIEPISVLAHTVASVPLKVLLAWIVGTLGLSIPKFFISGYDVRDFIESVAEQFLFFPISAAMTSTYRHDGQAWTFVAVPLLFVLALKVFFFLRDEGRIMDLVWFFLLSYFIAIPTYHSHWPYAALAGGIAVIVAGWYQRRLSKESDS